jgi:uncharacterized protein (TIGR03083 family)
MEEATAARSGLVDSARHDSDGLDSGGPDSAEAEKKRVVELLGAEWSVIADLLAGLDDAAWSRSALPGWDVHDVLAHLIGTERMLAGERAPDPADISTGGHVRNAIGEANEAWVVALRDRTHADLLDDFRTVTAARLASLRAMSPEEFNAPSWTPAGQATYARFMQIRIFDCWMHEQDIRAAVGIPGNESGTVAEEALGEVVKALGYIVGKRGRAPDRSSVLIRLTGPVQRDLPVVVDGRARVVAAIEGEPTACLTLSSSLFFRLAGGRDHAEAVVGRIELAGDTGLARQVATHLAYTI